VHIGKC